MSNRMTIRCEEGLLAFLVAVGALPVVILDFQRVAARPVRDAGNVINCVSASPSLIVASAGDDDSEEQEGSLEEDSVSGLAVVPPASLSLPQVAHLANTAVFKVVPVRQPLRC